MAVAQQQSSSHCDSTSGQKCNRPFSRWPKSSLQEPGSRETISLLGLIMSITRQEGLQTTGISSSTSVYRNTDVKKEETHCVQLRPGCLHRFGVQSTQACIPNLDWESPHPLTFLLMTSCPMEGGSLFSHLHLCQKPFPFRKWLFQKLFGTSFTSHYIILLRAPLLCSTFNLFFQFSK